MGARPDMTDHSGVIDPGRLIQASLIVFVKSVTQTRHTPSKPDNPFKKELNDPPQYLVLPLAGPASSPVLQSARRQINPAESPAGRSGTGVAGMFCWTGAWTETCRERISQRFSHRYNVCTDTAGGNMGTLLRSRRSPQLH